MVLRIGGATTAVTHSVSHTQRASLLIDHCAGLGAGTPMAADVDENLQNRENHETVVESPFLDGFRSFLAVFPNYIFLRVFSTNLTWIFCF